MLQCGHGSKAVVIITQNPLSSVRSPCFNAATAPRPWRSPPPLRPVAFMTGFNAATAPRPWRSGDFAVPSDWSDTLQCGHGSKAVEITVQRKLLSSAVQLQCVHGSKAVEMDSVPMYLRPAIRLQCGHGSKAVEINQMRGDVLPVYMLQCGHGSKAVEIHLVRPRGRGGKRASMRPRLQGRGDDPTGAGLTLDDIELQCGHGSKAVEITLVGRQSSIDGESLRSLYRAAAKVK